MSIRKVTIYGSGQSILFADFKTRSAKWSVGSMFKLFGDYIDLYFCMHDHDPVHLISKLETTGYIDKQRYPLKKIMQRYGSRYFTNSISYMIAYAMHKGYREIELIGVDVLPYGEWAFERPSIAYWCGRAESLGIKIKWPLLDTAFLYGYEAEDMDRMKDILNKKLEIANKEFDAAEDQRIKDQWGGYKLAVEQLIREVRS